MKKLKISRLTPDSRYLQTVALNHCTIRALLTHVKIKMKYFVQIFGSSKLPNQNYYTFNYLFLDITSKPTHLFIHVQERKYWDEFVHSRSQYSFDKPPF